MSRGQSKLPGSCFSSRHCKGLLLRSEKRHHSQNMFTDKFAETLVRSDIIRVVVSEIEETHYLTELPLPSFIPHRYQPGGLGTWSGHLAFANDLITALRPSLIVELGTHWGESYFGFCQSVFQGGLSCLCYAIDTWLGDQHSELYGEEVFRDVARYNEAHYRTFSYLLQTRFETAVDQFSYESIDLLHIDGLHTYEAVKKDFEQWFPRVSPGGIVLFHDTAARHSDFGVWAFWDELQKEFRKTFTFHHSWGLGVLRKPGGKAEHQSFLDLLFNSPETVRESVRRHYVLYASFLEQTSGKDPSGARNAAGPTRPQATGIEAFAGGGRTTIQVYPAGIDGYSESDSMAQRLEVGSSQNLIFEFTQRGNGPLRIDPADRPCLVEISRIEVKDVDSNEVIWMLEQDTTFSGITVSGSALLCEDTRTLKILSYGFDPQLELSTLDLADRRVRVELRLRADDSLSAMCSVFERIAITRQKAQSELAEAQKDRQAAVSESETLRRELMASRTEQTLLAAELRAAITERNDARRERKVAENTVNEVRGRHVALTSEIAELQASLAAESDRLAAVSEALTAERRAVEAERRMREEIFRSLSWRMTKPARDFMAAARGLSSRRELPKA